LAVAAVAAVAAGKAGKAGKAATAFAVVAAYGGALVVQEQVLSEIVVPIDVRYEEKVRAVNWVVGCR
jgi:hypothetical protein